MIAAARNSGVGFSLRNRCTPHRIRLTGPSANFW